MLFGRERELLGRISENFLIRALAKNEVRINEAVCRAISASNRWHKRDCPLKPVIVVWLIVMMALYRNLSIPNVFRRMLGLIRVREGGLSLRPVTPEALHHARSRVGADTLKYLFEELSDQNGWTLTCYNGHRAIGVDGTFFRIPDTAANEHEFGRKNGSRGTAGYPQVQSVSLVDLTTHKVIDLELQHCHGSEREALKKLANRRLGTGDLLLMDRGLAAFEVFNLCQSLDLNFINRLPCTWKPQFVEEFETGDILVDVHPCKVEQDRLRAAGQDPNQVLRLRLLSYEIEEGETVRLLTSLLCPERYPALSLCRFYHQRWEIELAFDELKTHFAAVTHGKQPTHFRSKTPNGVIQEAYGMMVAYNLVRDLMVEAARTEHDLQPLQLSFVDTLETIKTISPLLEMLPISKLARGHQKLLRDIAKCKLRPRRRRRYPRAVKVKMSNFKRKRERGGGETFDPLKLLHLIDIRRPDEP